MVGTVSDRPLIVNDISAVFGKFRHFGESFSWQVHYKYLVMLEGITSVAPRVVNNVSYVTRINHESHFSWQVQYLVMFHM